MQKTVNFNVTLTKDGQQHQFDLAVEKHHEYDLYNQEYEPWNLTAKTQNNKGFQQNIAESNALFNKTQSRIFEEGHKVFGKDLNGMRVDVIPNYHNAETDKAYIEEYVSLRKEFDPEANLSKLQEEAQQSLNRAKDEYSFFFPGHQRPEKSNIDKFANEAMGRQLEQNSGTYNIVGDVEYTMNGQLNGNAHLMNHENQKEPHHHTQNVTMELSR